MKMQKLTPVLMVDAIEPVLPFWVDRLGFQKTVEVPHEGRLGFVILVRDGVEIMYQTQDSVASDVPPLARSPQRGTFLFFEVDDLDAIAKALDGIAPVVPRRKTFYGAGRAHRARAGRQYRHVRAVRKERPSSARRFGRQSIVSCALSWLPAWRSAHQSPPPPSRKTPRASIRRRSTASSASTSPTSRSSASPSGSCKHGKVVFARGYGVADRETQRPVGPNTMFAIGSVSKQFTCSAVLMLQEQGKLSLRDPVAKYYPGLTRAKDITLLDLGGHLSGYRDYYPLDYVNLEMSRPAPADTIIARYAMRALDFEPRSRYSYSNTGYLILGRVVEKVSGDSFGSFLNRRIITPLKLTRTAYEPSPSGTDMARGNTSFGLAEQIPAMPEAEGWVGAAGAIWSTPTDLLVWDQSLLDHKLLLPASYRVLTTPLRLTDGRTSGYGCGQVVNDRGQAVTYSHGGAVSGFVAQNTIIPSTRSALVLLSNSDFSPTGALNQELLSKLLPSVDVPVVKGMPALDAPDGKIEEFLFSRN